MRKISFLYSRRLSLVFTRDASKKANTNMEVLSRRENGLYAGIRTKEQAPASIFFPLVLVLALILAFAQQQAKTKYRSGITQAQGYLTTCGCVWLLKSLNPDFLEPKQFSKMTKDSEDFACTCVCVEFHFHSGHPYCLLLCSSRH